MLTEPFGSLEQFRLEDVKVEDIGQHEDVLEKDARFILLGLHINEVGKIRIDEL